jgi:hypothetical protein
MRYLDSLSNDVYLVVWFQGGREDAREFARECSRKQAEGRVQEIFERALRRITWSENQYSLCAWIV